MKARHLPVCIALISFALAGCQSKAPVETSVVPEPASAPAAAATEMAVTSAASWFERAGIRCEATSSTGVPSDCTAGAAAVGLSYSVELSSGCDNDGFFAGVHAPEGVSASIHIPGADSDSRQSGKLADNQFVCIRAIARHGQDPLYYYVKAMDPADVPACRGDATCGDHRPAPEAACAQARPEGCVSGWVRADALEVFSNGIGGSGE